jgi:SAM-dependent methyltransferase
MNSYTILNNKYHSIDEIVDAFKNSGLRIDLGCGYSKPPGFIGIDNLIGEAAQIQNLENAPDILMEINNTLFPFGDSTCVEVRASHFLEHSPNIDHVFNETFRVLKPNGIFLFAVPYANSAEGMYPGHSIFFTEKFFFEHRNFQSKFEIIKEEYFPSSYYQNLNPIIKFIIPFNFARIFLYNACWQMILHCRVRK